MEFEWDEAKAGENLIGLSVRDRVLVLIHTERHGKIRIIGCRKAKARERRHYEEG
jgi:uncharacterized DUF497 family protein